VFPCREKYKCANADFETHYVYLTTKGKSIITSDTPACALGIIPKFNEREHMLQYISCQVTRKTEENTHCIVVFNRLHEMRATTNAKLATKQNSQPLSIFETFCPSTKNDFVII
jgi:hypothetical protein